MAPSAARPLPRSYSGQRYWISQRHPVEYSCYFMEPVRSSGRRKARLPRAGDKRKPVFFRDRVYVTCVGALSAWLPGCLPR